MKQQKPIFSKSLRSLRSLRLISAFGFCLLLAAATIASGQTPALSSPSSVSSSTNVGPRIQFSELTFNFGKINSGDAVEHTFQFTNTGNAVLEVTSVRPSCGCTTAGEWDKRVQPGKTGSIPIQFHSGGYSGPVAKNIAIYCNDPTQTNIILKLTGALWRPFDITPLYVMFSLGPDDQTNQTRAVKIVSNLDEPVTLSDLQCTNGTFRPELKTIRDGKEFELQVTAVPPFTANKGWTPIVFKTSSSKEPEITVNAFVSVRSALMVSPPHITLPTGTLTNSTKFTVTIRNASTNSISLSDPAINVDGAELKLVELQAGHLFNLNATFPAGFKSQPGKTLEVTVKSSDSKQPVIKIPIVPSQIPSMPSVGLTATVPTALQANISASNPEKNPSVQTPAAVASQR